MLVYLKGKAFIRPQHWQAMASVMVDELIELIRDEDTAMDVRHQLFQGFPGLTPYNMNLAELQDFLATHGILYLEQDGNISFYFDQMNDILMGKCLPWINIQSSLIFFDTEQECLVQYDHETPGSGNIEKLYGFLYELEWRKP